MASVGANSPVNLAVQPLASRELAPLPVGSYGSYASPANRELSLGLLWRVALEWRWLILAALGAGIAAAVLITLLTPLKYRSAVMLELNPPQNEMLDDPSGSGKAAVARADPAFIGTQLGLLGSRALADRVAQDLNLAAEPKVVGATTDRTAAAATASGYVQQGLTSQLQPNSRLVQLAFVARDPVLAARIVNGAADAYINTNLERRYQSTSYARKFLERQIATTRRDLERSERELVAYAQQQRLITTAGTGQNDGNSDTNSLTGNTLLALNSALAQTQARRIAAEQRYREAAIGGTTTESSESSAVLRQQIASLEAEYQQKLQTFRPDYPEMAALKARVDALRRAAASETRNAGANRSASLRQEYLAARAEEARLRSNVSQLSASVLDQRGRRIKYNILQRDVDTNRTLYDGLLQRYKEVGVASGVGSASASVVDRGEAPGAPFSPNLYLNLGLGALLGLASGLLTALALEFINDTIKTPDDVRNKLQLPFLGGIPVSKLSRPVDELKDPLSGVTEAYLSTATALQFIAEGGAPKTMLVTSTRPAEGKSTSAWALAQSYSRLGKSVLLIDADMRRPAFVTGHVDVGLSHIRVVAFSKLRANLYYI